MKKDNTDSNLSPRENFLLNLLRRLSTEYKSLMDYVRHRKPYKIVEIHEISNVPGETKFTIQLVNKNCAISLTAAEVIEQKYNLNDFSDFHAAIIKQATIGKLAEFLNLSDKEYLFQITSKKYDTTSKQYIFTILAKNGSEFVRTANELARDKKTLAGMRFFDIYDIGYTQGSESIVKERAAILLAQKNN